MCARMDKHKAVTGRYRQAGQADLRHAPLRLGIHRSGAGLVRGALPPAAFAQPRSEGQGAGDAASCVWQYLLKNIENQSVVRFL